MSCNINITAYRRVDGKTCAYFALQVHTYDFRAEFYYQLPSLEKLTFKHGLKINNTQEETCIFCNSCYCS